MILPLQSRFCRTDRWDTKSQAERIIARVLPFFLFKYLLLRFLFEKRERERERLSSLWSHCCSTIWKQKFRMAEKNSVNRGHW